MKKYVMITIVLLVAGGLYSCFKKDWRSAMRGVDRKEIYGNTLEGWEEVDTTPPDRSGNTFVTLKKYDKDTLKVLWVAIHDNTQMMVNEYNRYFRCGEDSCVIVMNEADTLFFYKIHDLKKEFVMGGYQYKYIHGELDSAENKYYTLHEDSLRKVKGNSLPKLVE